MFSRISGLSIPFRMVPSRNVCFYSSGSNPSSSVSGQANHFTPPFVRQLHHSAGLRATVKNIQQVQDAFTREATEQNVDVLTLRDAKKFLHILGFKRQGENYLGPKGMQAHVDMGTSKGHGDHLDLTQKGWEKIKVKVDPKIRLE